MICRLCVPNLNAIHQKLLEDKRFKGFLKKNHKNSKDSNFKNIEPLYCAEHSGEYA